MPEVSVLSVIGNYAVACPCCGAEIPGDQVVLDPATNVVSYGGLAVRLRRMEARLLTAILRAHPGAAHPDAMVSEMWGFLDPPLTATDLIKVHISYLRRRLEGLGLEIRSSYGEGYALRIHGTDERPRAIPAPRRRRVVP